MLNTDGLVATTSSGIGLFEGQIAYSENGKKFYNSRHTYEPWNFDDLSYMMSIFQRGVEGFLATIVMVENDEDQAT